MVSTMPRDQSQGTWAKATGVCVPRHKVGVVQGEQAPHHPAGYRAREKQVCIAGGIKESFGYDLDKTSGPICESHTVVPQSHGLIIMYQEYLIRDVGGKWVSS